MPPTAQSPELSAIDDRRYRRERCQVIDVVRGIAVIGMLLGNITYFASPLSIALSRYWQKPADHVASLAVTFFISGKLYSMFAMLFGLGCARYVQRARSAREGLALYFRRMAVLFVLGGVHVLLLSPADILHMYAVLGLLLLLFTRLSNRALLVAAAVCISLPILFSAGQAVLASRAAAGGGDDTKAAAESMSAYITQTRIAVRNYRQGTFGEIVAQRIVDIRRRFVPVLIAAPHVFGMMLLGMYIYRRRIFEEAAQHRRLLWRVIVWTLPLGLLLNGFAVFGSEMVSAAMMSQLIAVVADASYLLGATAFALLYAASAVLWFAPPQSRVAVWLAAVGRLALSNYVAQSLICTTIFLSYGFGLYARLGPGTVVPWAMVIAVALTIASVLWTRRFQYGPLEWIWRTLSYGRIQPFRVREIVPA